jgi:hypothetical protein
MNLRLGLMACGGLLIEAELGLWNAAEVLLEDRTLQMLP